MSTTAISQSRPLRILAVDDEESILSAYQKILTPERKSDAVSDLEALRDNLFGSESSNENFVPAVDETQIELECANQAEQAVRLVADAAESGNPYALVLLDMRMPPGRDGAWAANEIRQIDPNIDIVVVTAFSDVDPRDLSAQVPPSDKIYYIQKPFHPHEIVQFATALGTRWQANKMLGSQKEQNERLGRLVNSSSNEIYVFDVATKACVLVNQTACNNLGYEVNELEHMSLADIDKDFEEAKFAESLTELSKHENEIKTYRSTYVRKNGSSYPVEVNLHIDEEVSGQVLVAIVKDISEQEEAEKRVHNLAYYDSVTGLANRQNFSENLKRTVSFAKRNKTRFATLFLDLDKFKRINDSLGHSFGDILLRRVGERLMQTVRAYDVVSRHAGGASETSVARLGGDEFTVLIPSISDAVEAESVADRIVHAVSQPYDINGHEIVITPSIGISMFPTDGDSVDELLKNADTAMYHAKQSKESRYEFFSQTMSRRASEKFSLEMSLRTCLENNELELHYQPQIDIKTRQIVGAEALVRWNRPNVGLTFPNDFIPFAEDSGFITAVGQWVLNEAVAELKRWSDAGLDLYMSVNISAVQFRYSGLTDIIKSIVAEHGISADTLHIEMTESAIMQAADASIETLNYLKSTGVSIAIDDFGIGYSSLSYLQRFAIDVLKIDRSFVSGLESSEDCLAITRAIIAMAHSLELDIVAEGVETETQLRILRELEVDRIQGYLFSHPIPASDFLALVHNNDHL